MKKTIFIVFLLIGLLIQAQDHSIDTSYTLSSAFLKLKPKYPAIRKVLPLPHSSLQKDRDIQYKTYTDDTLRLDAWYTKDKKQPAIVLVHGGGWKSGNKSMMAALAQNLALNGYQCFAVQYSLSAQRSYPAGIKDIKTAIQFIRVNANRYFVDNSRIAILGCSAGGQLAALVGTTNGKPEFEDENSVYQASTDVQAIVNIDGILSFDHPESEEGEVAALWLGGDKEIASGAWQAASPLYHTGKNTPPILFINGKDDRFHAGRDDMIQLLDRYDIFNETYHLEDAPHTFWLFEPWFEPTSNYVITFLDKTFN